MITLKDIKLAINNLIEATFPEIEISSKDIKEGFSRPSFFIDFEAMSKHSTEEQVIRELQIIIYYFPSDPHKNSLELLEVQEKLEEVFDLKLNVSDRYFNIDDPSGVKSDGVLQFSFSIKYEEGREIEEAELMENLIIKEA